MDFFCSISFFDVTIFHVKNKYIAITLTETNSKFATENGWLEDDPFLLINPIFRGELLVLGRFFAFFKSMVGR